MSTATMHLLVAPSSGLSPQAVGRITFSGLDQIPTPCRSQLRGQELVIEHNTTDSGRLHVPFLVPGRGEVVLSTGTLMHRERPYLLEVELARGKLNQLRNQLADWIGLGLTVPPVVDAAARRAVDEFGRAVVASQSDPEFAVEQSRQAIVATLEAAEMLVDCYIEQALALRHRQTQQLPTALISELPPRPLQSQTLTALMQTFNAVAVPMSWRQVESTEGQHDWSAVDATVEAAQGLRLPIISGPIISLESFFLPDWVKMWSGDIEGFVSFAVDFASQAVERYRGKVALWQVAARVNSGAALSLPEESRLQLAMRLVEAVRKLDPQVPSILRFDQPYGDYLRRPGAEFDFAPLHFAEALVRAGLQINGIGLELNFGYLPGGTCSHDRLDLNRMLDMWSYLSLPLHITLTAPSAQTPDPRSLNQAHVVPDGKPWTNESQAHWVSHFVPLLLSKAYVHTVSWNQLSDSDPHEFPHGGLFDAQGNAKPAFSVLAHLRRKHLH